jgi:hypothetical protein
MGTDTNITSYTYITCKYGYNRGSDQVTVISMLCKFFRSLLANTHIPTAPPCVYCSLKELSSKCDYCENGWQTLFTVVNELPHVLPHFWTDLDKIRYGMTSEAVMLLLLLPWFRKCCHVRLKSYYYYYYYYYYYWLDSGNGAKLRCDVTTTDLTGDNWSLFVADILFRDHPDHPQTNAQTAQANNKANGKPRAVYFWSFQTKSIVFVFYSILFYT